MKFEPSNSKLYIKEFDEIEYITSLEKNLEIFIYSL